MKGDIDAEIAKRSDVYTGAIDRAADRIGSQNEADLIGKGMQDSRLGELTRDELVRRFAQEYQNAEQRAYDDGLGYITGEAGFLNNEVVAEMQHRLAQLNEDQCCWWCWYSKS